MWVGWFLLARGSRFSDFHRLTDAATLDPSVIVFLEELRTSNTVMVLQKPGDRLNMPPIYRPK